MHESLQYKSHKFKFIMMISNSLRKLKHKKHKNLLKNNI